jgi:hypothetical protein
LGQPVPKRPGTECHAPLLVDRQRHRPHPAFPRSRGRALLEQPCLEFIGVRVGSGGALEQLALDGEPDRIRRRIALATFAPAFGRCERREQLAADVARTVQRVQK